jgi:hypothetical protein
MNFPRLACALALGLSLAACAGQPVRLADPGDAGTYVVVSEVPDSRISTVEYQVRVNAPAWRMWNAAQDVEGMFRLTSSYRLVGQPARTGPRSVQFVIAAKPVWYAPTFTAVVAGRVLTDQLGWEDECVSGLFDECYLRFTIVPSADGQTCVLQGKGYFRRPWFVAHHHLVHVVEDTYRSVRASINLKINQDKYAQADARLPWQEVFQLGIGAPAAVKPPADAKRTRLAVERLQTYPAGETTSAVGAIVMDYLGYKLAQAGRYEVVMPGDINLMARYLGQNWALLCGEDEACKTRIAHMAQADYLLSGELRREGAEYHLSLVLLRESEGRAVWRAQRTVPAELGQIKAALEDAVAELATQKL